MKKSAERTGGFFARPTAREDDYRAVLLHYVTNFVLIAMSLHTLIEGAAGVLRVSHVFATGFGAGACLASRYALTRGRVQLGASIFVGVFWISSVALVMREGWASPTTDVFFLVLVGSAALLGRRGALIVAGATLAVVLFAGFAESRGWVTPRPFTSAGGLAVGWTSMLAGIGFILYMLVRQLERMLQKARHSEERYAALVRASPDGIIVFDADGHLLTASPAAESITGFSAQELKGVAIDGLPFLDADDRKRALDRFHAARSGASEVPTEYEIRRKNGDAKTIEVNRSWVKTDDGVELFQATLRDVTVRRQALDKQRVLEEQLHHAQRLESVGRLAGGVAHEFNNCLTAILGGLEMAKRNPSATDALKQDLGLARKAALRAADVTRELLEFARRDGGLTSSAVNDTVGELQTLLERLVSEDIEYKTNLAATTDTVGIGRTQLEQIVVNLVVNASDAMTRRGRITIETENVEDARAKPQVLIRVADTGPGMPEDVRSRIFEPFFTTKGVGVGTGLGLSVVHGIVTKANGSIVVDSQLDKGTTFEIRLPVVEPVTTTNARAASPSSTAADTPGTILLIDDDFAVARATERLLQGANHEVLIANDSESALALLQERSGDVDLVLTDVVLRNERGPEVVRQLCAVRPDLKALYMSGYTAGFLSEHDIGADQLLTKPFTAEELTERIDAMLTAD